MNSGNILPRKGLRILLCASMLVLSIAALLGQTGEPPKTSSAAPAAPAEPPADGAYYLAPDGWRQLQHLLSFAKGRHHLVRSLIPPFTPQRTLKFRGAEAPVKISAARPTFLLKGFPEVAGGSIRDVVLVKLDKGKDYRAMPVTSGATVFQFKMTLPKDHTPEIVVTPQSSSVFTVTPRADLAPGEYMLTFGTGQVGGFDFTVLPRTAPMQQDGVLRSALPPPSS